MIRQSGCISIASDALKQWIVYLSIEMAVHPAAELFIPDDPASSVDGLMSVLSTMAL